jgi:hypothetical protein
VPLTQTLTKEKILDNISLFCILLEFQPNMKNWIFCHYTGLPNYTNVLTYSVILLGLPNAPRNLAKYYQHLFNYRSMGGVNRTLILKNSKDLLEYMYVQLRSLSSCNIIKIFDFSNQYETDLIKISIYISHSRHGMTEKFLTWR